MQHTLVEIHNNYLDVTADQFNTGMYSNHQFKSIMFTHGLPYGIRYEEPSYEEVFGEL